MKRRFYYLPYVVVLIALLAFCSSCITEKKRAKICGSCPSKIEVKDSIVERLVEVPVYTPPIPGPTLYLPSPCAALCDSLGNLKPFTIEKKQNGIKTTLKSNLVNNTLEIASNLEDSTKTLAKVNVKDHYHSKQEVIQAPCKLEHVNWWNKFCVYFTLVIGTLLLIYFYIRVRGIIAK